MQQTAVIITALEVEYNAARQHLAFLREERYPQGNVYERGIFSSTGSTWDIVIVQTRKGNVRAGIQTERAIAHFNPSIVLFIGVAGGLKDVNLGDVVVAEKVYAYESGKDKGSFKARPNVGISSFGLIERAQTEARRKGWLRRILRPGRRKLPQVFIGPIAAGEKVIASKRSATFRFIKDNYSDTLAVDMEDYGFLEAINANPNVQALVIRGISDLVSGKEKTDKEGWQTKAALHASAFAFEVLAKFTKKGETTRSNGLSSKENRDRKTLLDLLNNVPTPVFDFFLENLQHFVINNDIFHYWIGFHYTVSAGAFHILDPGLRRRVERLARAWADSLDFGQYAFSLFNADAFRISPPPERIEEVNRSFSDASRAVEKAYNSFLSYVKTHFPDIDLSATSKKAMKLHLKEIKRLSVPN
jgi:nucleoside phosphorylase